MSIRVNLISASASAVINMALISAFLSISVPSIAEEGNPGGGNEFGTHEGEAWAFIFSRGCSFFIDSTPRSLLSRISYLKPRQNLQKPLFVSCSAISKNGSVRKAWVPIDDLGQIYTTSGSLLSFELRPIIRM